MSQSTLPEPTDDQFHWQGAPPLGLLVEYDLQYWGGDYHGVGQQRWIPEALIREYNDNVRAAFHALTAIDPRHIVHYSTVRHTRDGQPA